MAGKIVPGILQNRSAKEKKEKENRSRHVTEIKGFLHLTGLELNYSNWEMEPFTSLVKGLLCLSMASRFATIPKEVSGMETHKALLRNVAGSHCFRASLKKGIESFV